MAALADRPTRLPMNAACKALGLNRSTVYSYRRVGPPKPAQRSRANSCQPRALNPAEQQTIVDTLTSDEFKDQPPLEVYHRLLQQGIYLASISTMHRLLRRQKLNGDRRNQRPAQHHAVPRLLAYGPNEVWTWDITKLPLVRSWVNHDLDAA